MERIRHIKLFKNYFKDFYINQIEVVRDKINYVLRLVETQKVIPKRFFRAIEGVDGLFEIRVEAEGNIFRIFCCFDDGSLIILFHGFQKKTDKTPKREIERAVMIMREYFKSKEER